VPFSLEQGGPAPTTEVFCGLLSGRAGLKLKFHEYPVLAAPTRVAWNSAFQERSEPIRINDKEMDVWNKWWSKTVDANERAQQLQAAATHYANRFNSNKPDEARIDVAFYSAIQDPRELPGRRVFALRCLQALDAPEYFANALSDDSPLMRELAIGCVQHWTGLRPERDLILYKLLVDKKSYTEAQAQAVLQLLHQFAQADYEKPEIAAALFEAMKHEKVAVRELAYKHLAFSDPVGARDVGLFDAGAPAEIRDAVLQRWKASWKKRFIDKK
jgi:fructose-specific component phosphotransferase system IIB-like protein